MNKAEVDTYRENLLNRLTRLETKHEAHYEVTKEIRDKGSISMEHLVTAWATNIGMFGTMKTVVF